MRHTLPRVLKPPTIFHLWSFSSIADTTKDEPMCMAQYSRLFGTYRLPAVPSDTIHIHPQSNHVLLISRGRFFAVDILDKTTGAPLTETLWQQQVERVLATTANSPVAGAQF